MSGKIIKLPPRNVIELREEDVIEPLPQMPGIIDPQDMSRAWWFAVGSCFGIGVANFLTWVMS